MLTASDLRIVYFAPIEPDVIVTEVWIGEERLIVELIWGYDGSKKLCLSEGAGAELGSAEFLTILGTEAGRLDEWAASLRLPGAAWDPLNGYYNEKSKPLRSSRDTMLPARPIVTFSLNIIS